MLVCKVFFLFHYLKRHQSFRFKVPVFTIRCVLTCSSIMLLSNDLFFEMNNRLQVILGLRQLGGESSKHLDLSLSLTDRDRDYSNVVFGAQ